MGIVEVPLNLQGNGWEDLVLPHFGGHFSNPNCFLQAQLDRDNFFPPYSMSKVFLLGQECIPSKHKIPDHEYHGMVQWRGLMHKKSKRDPEMTWFADQRATSKCNLCQADLQFTRQFIVPSLPAPTNLCCCWSLTLLCRLIVSCCDQT